MGDLIKCPNIGKILEQQLLEVGITTPEALREIGSRNAWLRIQAIDSSACYNRLLALEGAIQGIPKKTLPEEAKQDLKAFYRAHKL